MTTGCKIWLWICLSANVIVMIISVTVQLDSGEGIYELIAGFAGVAGCCLLLLENKKGFFIIIGRNIAGVIVGFTAGTGILSIISAVLNTGITYYFITRQPSAPISLIKNSFDQNASAAEAGVDDGSRYCPYCGSRVYETKRFCSNCWETIKPEDLTRSPVASAWGSADQTRMLLSVILGIAAAIMPFLNWIEVDLYFTSGEYTLFELAELFSDLSSSWMYHYADAEGKALQVMLQIDMVLFNVIGAGVIIAEAIYCIMLFAKHPKAGFLGKTGARLASSIGSYFILSIILEFGIGEIQNIKIAPILIICFGIIQGVLLNPKKRNERIL